jgi:mediator of RNA polymerase II transcription subunit 21
LISVLPGIDSSEAQQGARIRELEGELRGVEKRRDDKVGELREAKRRLEKVLGVVEWGVFGERFQS